MKAVNFMNNTSNEILAANLAKLDIVPYLNMAANWLNRIYKHQKLFSML